MVDSPDERRRLIYGDHEPGNLRRGAPLAPIFGELEGPRETALRHALVLTEDDLATLADAASEKLGTRFWTAGLGLFTHLREISGGASRDPGDFWFEIVCSSDRESGWQVTADVLVHCDLMPLGGSCLHTLFSDEVQADTPEGAAEALNRLVLEMTNRLGDLPTEKFHKYRHDQLPPESTRP